MKRYSTDRRNWKRVPKQEVKLKSLDGTTLVYLKALQVTEPLVISSCGEKVRIMDTGYQWIFICKPGANHIVTAQCNAEQQTMHYYIDIINSWGFDQNGFPYFDDLYLDLNVLPDGRAEILDQEALEEALTTGSINQTHYTLARNETQRIYETVQEKTFIPIQLTSKYLELFQ